MLVGIYETNPQHWSMDGAPWDYGVELLQENIDRISGELELVHRRYPVLQTAGIRKWVNGAFTFSPDGNPLVGPVAGKPGYWLACGVMAGFLQGGGVGKALAEWMIRGETTEDVFGLDIARYGLHTSNREYIRQTTGEFYARRFVMTYPERTVARRPAAENDARLRRDDRGWLPMGQFLGTRSSALFRPVRVQGEADAQALERLRHCRRGVPHGARRRRPSRYRVVLTLRGDGSRGRKLARLADGLPHAESRAGRGSRRCCLRRASSRAISRSSTGATGPSGSKAPTIFAGWHMRWFADHAREGVTVRDISDDVIGFSLSGPKSRALLERITHQDVSNAALPFMGAAVLDVGLIRAKVARLSVTGELGYEINCRALEHATLRQNAARRRPRPRRQGIRLQRSARAPAREELRHLVGRVHPGLHAADDRHGPLDRLGQGRVRRQEGGARRARGPCPLAHAGDARNRRARRRRFGLRTGLAQRREGRLRDLGRLRPHDRQKPGDGARRAGGGRIGTALSVHIVGAERRARVIAPSPYDPAGKAMRA